MGSESKRWRALVALMAMVGIAGVVTGVVAQRGLTLATVPVIVGGVLIWGLVWIGGFRLGSAFAEWLERRWHG